METQKKRSSRTAMSAETEGSRARASPAPLCCVLGQDINPSLVLVQPSKTRPFINERLLMGYKESNQTKQNISRVASSVTSKIKLLVENNNNNINNTNSKWSSAISRCAVPKSASLLYQPQRRDVARDCWCLAQDVIKL